MQVFFSVLLALCAVFLSPVSALAQANWPGQFNGSTTQRDVHFSDGTVLAEVKRGYVTLGFPKRDARGAITNAVLLLHGTSGTSADWLRPQTASPLFGAGRPLDLADHYVVIPDGIGRGGSSKPSDGLRAKFPHYRYRDMVMADHRLLTEALGITHLRLVMGTSMGGMQTWMWAEMFPDFMDAAVPIATQAVAIGGRNWMMRQVSIDAIRNDPEWNGGDYSKQPTLWTKTAPVIALMSDSVVQLQKSAPDVASGRKLLDAWAAAAARNDANDTLWAREAVQDYNPEPDAVRIRARLMALNFADDAVNPPELDTLAPVVRRIPRARYVLLPAGLTTRGHLAYQDSSLWVDELARFLRVSSND
jgi:homoserine O-acetyltransferase